MLNAKITDTCSEDAENVSASSEHIIDLLIIVAFVFGYISRIKNLWCGFAAVYNPAVRKKIDGATSSRFIAMRPANRSAGSFAQNSDSKILDFMLLFKNERFANKTEN